MTDVAHMSTNGTGTTTPATLSRTEKFMVRVVEHLATLAPAERPVWLRRQIAVWERRYEDWAKAVDMDQAGEPGQETIDDYLDTISALNRLLHRIEP